MIFTYEEALATFPQIQKITTESVREVQALVQDCEDREETEEQRGELDEAYQAIILKWAEQVLSFGCEIKGLWLVDWDCGVGYYCWRYPEETLGYFHSYEEGFQGRLPIA